MNNTDAQANITECLDELQRIFHLIEGLGHMSPVVPFLTKYAIVRACGSAEFCFKTIISDFTSVGCLPQVVNYIDNSIRNSSMNPSRTNISKTLKRFDTTWNDQFKAQLNGHTDSARLIDSIDSLNRARNSFAHGDNPTASFENIRNYFNDTIVILEMLDDVVS